MPQRVKEQSLTPPTNLPEALFSPNKRIKLARLGFISGLPVSDVTQHSEQLALIVTPCTICIGAGVLQNPALSDGVVHFPHR